MTMSTQTLDEAGRQLATLLIDKLQILNVGEPVTTGINVTLPLTPAGQPVDGLVQSVTLESPVDGRVMQGYSIKVPRGTALQAGQVVRVLNTRSDFDLVGMEILVDTISKNGLAMIRKGTGQKFTNINQQGKAGLS